MKFDQILWYTLDFDIEGSQKLDGMNKNWGRWSDKVDLKFSQRASFDAWLENILSTSVLKWLVTLFGIIIIIIIIIINLFCVEDYKNIK